MALSTPGFSTHSSTASDLPRLKKCEINLAMADPENEKTWLEDHLDNWIGSVRGLPRTLRKTKYLIALIVVAFLLLLQGLVDKSPGEILKEIAKAAFSGKESPQQSEPKPIPNIPLPLPDRVPHPKMNDDKIPSEKPALFSEHESQPRKVNGQPPLSSGSSASPKEIAIQYKRDCGETPFNLQSLQSRTTTELTARDLSSPAVIQLSGGLSHQVTEGSGSAALVVARFTICTGDSVGACPEPKLDCSVRCKYAKADSFAGNMLIATHELAGLLASGIDDAQRLNSPIIEGDICKVH